MAARQPAAGRMETTPGVLPRFRAENLALCGVAAALEATSRSWVSRMELQWRRLLTDRLHGTYFADMVGGGCGVGRGAAVASGRRWQTCANLAVPPGTAPLTSITSIPPLPLHAGRRTTS